MEIDLKLWDMNTIGHVFCHRWTAITLVAMIWATIVTVYVISGLRPHGYLQDVYEALLTWLVWMVGGSLLLAWVVRNKLFHDSSADRMIGASPRHAIPADDDGHLVDPAEDADRQDACGLRVGVAGFGYYCGAIRTDDD